MKEQLIKSHDRACRILALRADTCVTVPPIYDVSGDGELKTVLPKPVIFPGAKTRCKSIKIS